MRLHHILALIVSVLAALAIMIAVGNLPTAAGRDVEMPVGEDGEDKNLVSDH